MKKLEKISKDYLLIFRLLSLLTVFLSIIAGGNFIVSRSNKQVNAQTSDARFYFSPDSQEYKKGCSNTLQVMVDPGSNNSNAANIFINYDPMKIEILDSNSSLPGKQIGTGNAYEAYADNFIDEASGEIRLTGFSIMYDLRDVKSFGYIEFRSINDASSADFSIQFDGVGNTLDSNIAETNTSDDILGSVENASYSFVDGPCVEDTQAPSISPQSPGNYDSDVPLDSNLEVRICDNREWDSGVDIDTVEVIVNGETYTSENVEVFAFNGDSDCYNITINTPQDFVENEAVSVTYKASDFTGNSASRSIVFNIPPDEVDMPECPGLKDCPDCVEELISTQEDLQQCQDSNIIQMLPEGGVNQVVEENRDAVNAVSAIPAITGAISLASTLGFSLLELPYYLVQLFFWLLNLLGIRKKGKPWGTVYNSVSKAPIPRAVVRLFSQGKLIESKVTDVNGVFYMTPEEGIYTLIADKNGFSFPSTTIVGDQDGSRLNIYKGGPYEVKSDKDIVKLNIPMDPQEASSTKVLFKKVWNYINKFLQTLNPILLVLGIIVASVVYYFTGDLLNILWIVLNTIFLFLHFYVKHIAKSRWGYVVDKHGNPISNIELGIYDKKYGRLIDTRVTDEKGRYSFVVPGDVYEIKPTSNGYLIDDPANKGGYTVGQKSKGDISITEKIIVRRAR